MSDNKSKKDVGGQYTQTSGRTGLYAGQWGH